MVDGASRHLPGRSGINIQDVLKVAQPRHGHHKLCWTVFCFISVNIFPNIGGMRPKSFTQWDLQSAISTSLTIASVCPDRSAVFSFVFTFGHLNVRRSVCLWLCNNDHSRGHQQGKSLDVTNKPHTRWLAVTVSFVWSESSWRSAWESQALWPGEDHISRHVYFLNGHFIDFPTTRTLSGWPPTTRQTVPVTLTIFSLNILFQNVPDSCSMLYHLIAPTNYKLKPHGISDIFV